MNVLHVVAGNLDEGAAQGAYILHEKLLSKGVESFILTNSPYTDGYKQVKSISEGFISKMTSNLRMRLDNVYKLFYDQKDLKFSPGIFGYDITKTALFQKADIIHLHWICNGFIDVKDLDNIQKPIIWTLRDMWAMTGGCHYSMECNRFEHQCGSCPHLDSSRDKDLSTILQKRKGRAYSRNIRFVGISNWMTRQAEKSSLLREYEITTICNNIDLKFFFPSPKEEAKKSLSLSSDKPTLLFGAQYINSKYKGYDILLEVLETLDFEANVVFFGRNSPAKIKNPLITHTNLGYLKKEELQKAYSAADVFISTSRMEAFGKTVAEAMACGTPVVCFDETGSADIVDHKMNGYLAKPFKSEDIIAGIKYILNDSDYHSLVHRAIEKVTSCFDAEMITNEYIDLYEKVLKQC